MRRVGSKLENLLRSRFPVIDFVTFKIFEFLPVHFHQSEHAADELQGITGIVETDGMSSLRVE
jgi:hypothetical protein